MLRLANIMTKNVVTATPEMTLREAAELFASRHISGAPVVCGTKIVGVVSAADILAFGASERASDDDAAAEPALGSWTGPTADDEMSTDVLPSASYFTQLWSDASDAVSNRLDHPDGAEPDLLDEHTVDEIMSRPLVVLAPTDDVLRAATIMEEKSIHRVIVVEHGELVGIVSTLDIVRAVAERTLATRF
jgi:CBS domain-containing protein